jgi:hypothetical protein
MEMISRRANREFYSGRNTIYDDLQFRFLKLIEASPSLRGFRSIKYYGGSYC